MIIAVLIIIVLFIVLNDIIDYVQLRHKTEKMALPIVQTVTASALPVTEEIILPGYMTGWHATNIYARIDGYIVHWYVDIGAHVNAGDILAVISAPELEAALRQAQSLVLSAKANNRLAQATARRWLNLLKTNSVSRQETLEKVDAAKAAAALTAAAIANGDRLQQLVNFEKVIAPFDGIITQRNIDVGSLINAGNINKRPLFRIEQTNPLRLYVNVPERESLGLNSNVQVHFNVQQYPSQTFTAKWLHSAGVIDPMTRTLLTEFTVTNSKEYLSPGNYAEVHLRIHTAPQAVFVPSNTLLFRSQHLQVAILGKDNRVILKSIYIGRDFGTKVEVVSGISAGDVLIINPMDSIFNGQQVRVATVKDKDSNA